MLRTTIPKSFFNIKNSSILIYGGNGCGKTNVLEAISLLNQGKGLRKANIDNYLNQEKICNRFYKFSYC